MKVSIDTYCRPQKSFKQCQSIRITTNNRSPIGIGSYRLSNDLEPIVQGVIGLVQIQPRKHVPDHAVYTAPTRQHELDHTDHTDQESICQAWQI